MPVQKQYSVQWTYLSLAFFNTLALSFIWGINTIFLLDAGLNNLEAFAANAFFTVGQMIFEIPTGVIADTFGRRLSYLLGAITFGIATLLYLFAWQIHAPFYAWALISMLLGLGSAFFSGATDAWLVDALAFTGFKGALESVFAKGQIATGAAMLIGSIGGGVVAQVSNLGVPYIMRAAVLGVTFLIALLFMRDLGFTARKRTRVFQDMKNIFTTSITYGWRNPSIRWVMLAGPFSAGVGFYAFYAMQPHLLTLYGDERAYIIAGLAAAIVAGAQIVGGLMGSYVPLLFRKRTSVLIAGVIMSVLLLISIGLVEEFWLAILFLVMWSLFFAATMPVRQAYLNGLIPSAERATVLSFDSLIGSSGGVVIQPVLGRTADVWSYPASYVGAGIFQVLALPFLLLARREKPASDEMRRK